MRACPGRAAKGLAFRHNLPMSGKSSNSASRNSTWAALLVVVLLALCFRLPGVSWGLEAGDRFEPDENQSIGIARNWMRDFDLIGARDRQARVEWNARGFGVQLGAASYLGSLMGSGLGNGSLLYVGRLLSVAYGVLLVVLMFFLGTQIFSSQRAGFLAALILAGSDLSVTYGHYALPENAHVFWFWSAVFLLVLFYQGKIGFGAKVVLGVCIGMAVSFKHDPAPALAFLVLLFAKPETSWKTKLQDLFCVAGVALTALVVSWGTLDVNAYTDSVEAMWKRNQDTVKEGHHLLLNPVLYLSAVVAGTSLPAFAAAIAGLLRGFGSKAGGAWPERRTLAVLLLAPAIFAVIYWLGDATFIRRASVFIPFVALFGGAWLAQLESRRLRIVLPLFCVVYTFGLTGFSQIHFQNESRYMARSYLNENHDVPRDGVIAYTRYASAVVRGYDNAVRMRDQDWLQPEAYDQVSMVVLHETLYGRYAKYFTTPFQTPTSCKRVYHCNSSQMRFIQDVISERGPFRLLKRFDVVHPFPERRLFKALYGTYETFLGDLLIYTNPSFVPVGTAQRAEKPSET